MNSYHNKKIILENVKKSFQERLILKDINLYVSEGEIVALLGPSGSGKSTILNIISSLTEQDSGKVLVNGKISYMYQKDLLLSYKNIIDNVSLPLVLENKNKIEAREYAKKFLKTFGLEQYAKKFPHELSGGMKQRANFLRTYLCSQDIILLDEPFAALDSITKEHLQEWFLSVIKNINSTIFFITHDIDEAIKLSKRIYIISSKPAIIKKEINLVNIDKKNIFEISKIKKEILELLKD